MRATEMKACPLPKVVLPRMVFWAEAFSALEDAKYNAIASRYGCAATVSWRQMCHVVKLNLDDLLTMLERGRGLDVLEFDEEYVDLAHPVA